MFIKNETLV